MAKSVVEQALANIDEQIEGLHRAKQIIMDAASAGEAPTEKKPRKARVKRGLPTAAHEQ